MGPLIHPQPLLVNQVVPRRVDGEWKGQVFVTPLGADSRTVENMCYALYDQGHSGRAIVQELFFRTEDNKFNVAGYTVKGDSLVADKPRVRSEKSIANLGLTANSDLAPDGKRIAALMPTARPEDQKAQNQLIFLQNLWPKPSRRKIPHSDKTTSQALFPDSDVEGATLADYFRFAPDLPTTAASCQDIQPCLRESSMRFHSTLV